MNKNTIFIVSNQVVNNNAKVNWPDMNYPGSGETVLRYLYNVDFENFKVQLDGANGPVFTNKQLPVGAGFYKKI